MNPHGGFTLFSLPFFELCRWPTEGSDTENATSNFTGIKQWMAGHSRSVTPSLTHHHHHRMTHAVVAEISIGGLQYFGGNFNWRGRSRYYGGGSCDLFRCQCLSIKDDPTNGKDWTEARRTCGYPFMMNKIIMFGSCISSETFLP